MPSMKRIVRPCLACLWGLLLAGCAYKDQLPPVSALPSQTFSISGRVTGTDGLLQDITIELSENGMKGTPRTLRTGPDGSYRFDGLSVGSYILKPSKPGLLFTPATRTAAIIDAGMDEQNFTTAAPLVPMVTITGGTFAMGSERWEVEERPVRTAE